ncbi:conserved hypothetical protein [Verticillium alfalfae VaMs.102]|uniref:FHA domain-containing protein n=1 Tax=Verticillium alfalfae (strain VaMs.102 / ATCC MYA-4576 / FGSC 10136) TaxID=526221 RepID=C9S9A0_VERA1|nr:conserved hypothetical protein [Verticillium alfalfae VaMs.102]EEY15003.1 conserved hypothetical protein [Verticillium alfalfae VaMs.102]
MNSSPPRKNHGVLGSLAAGSRACTNPSATIRSLFPLSPGFPRPVKKAGTKSSVGGAGAHLKYPTPVPTSSTGILSSSPPRVARRPSIVRPGSSSAERAPLASVPSIELNDNGETLLMGRSSNSSHYQLSGNRLVSRVHVKARYVPAASPLHPNKIEIVCNGWNGLKLHCQGRTWELLKGDSFTSETEGTEIMVDVHDARLMIQWPKKDLRDALGNLSDSSWEDSPRPQARGVAALQSSPIRRAPRIETPESPTPATTNTSSQRLQSLLPASASDEIQIFEDFSAEDDLLKHASLVKEEEVEPSPKREPSPAPAIENPTVKNHVVNQLAFSRLSSTPLSAIMNALPAEEKRGLTKSTLRSIIEGTVCIGIISRQGKDAAGQALESEYYYMPEGDDDEQRRLAVTDGLRKPSLRACRKQHKQYYWKRPRTP